jgi:hypothetical protein
VIPCLGAWCARKSRVGNTCPSFSSSIPHTLRPPSIPTMGNSCKHSLVTLPIIPIAFYFGQTPIANADNLKHPRNLVSTPPHAIPFGAISLHSLQISSVFDPGPLPNTVGGIGLPPPPSMMLADGPRCRTPLLPLILPYLTISLYSQISLQLAITNAMLLSPICPVLHTLVCRP